MDRYYKLCHFQQCRWKHLSFSEKGIILHTICWKDALEKTAKLELVFSMQSMNCVADDWGEKMLYCNNEREIDQELDSNLILRNVSQNSPTYNIKYMEQTKN